MQKTNDFLEILHGNPYPGRGVAIGLTPAGNAVMVYFIMGRSENSRNRVFTETIDGIVTEAADPTKLTDPSLIIYAPVRKIADTTIVTNGDQTDTIAEFLQQGKTFEDALRTRMFEPDAPNFTPRISGIINVQAGKPNYKLSILKSEGQGATTQRFFWEYPQPTLGVGHFIHTYARVEEPLPSFEGEPVAIGIPENTAVFANNIWDSLDNINKISLFVKSIDANGKEKVFIFNKYSRSYT